MADDKLSLFGDSLPARPIRAIGIDLGTTYSSVAEAVWDPGTRFPRIRCLDFPPETSSGMAPSMVAISEGRTLVGQAAYALRTQLKRRGPVAGERFYANCKNDMGLPTVYDGPEGFRTPVDIAGHLLGFLMRTARGDTDAVIDHVVVTVPASFQTAQRRGTLDAARAAGIEASQLTLLDEPEAAFLDYVSCARRDAFEFGREYRTLVFDFGGGTCDVSVFLLRPSLVAGVAPRLSPLAVSRYHRLGGGDIDLAILHEVLIPQLLEQNDLERFALDFDDKRQLLADAFLDLAENLKKRCCARHGESPDTLVGIEGVFPGKDAALLLHDGTPVTLMNPRISLGQFEALLAPFLDQDILYPREQEYRMTCSIFGPLDDAVSRSGLQPEQIDLVVLTGGSSLIPQVANAVKGHFPRARMLRSRNPMQVQTSVARGAAWQALSLAMRGHGVLAQCSHDAILLRTQSDPVELVPRGATLPYPSNNGANGKRWAEIHDLEIPETHLGRELPLRVEVEDSGGAALFSTVWPIREIALQKGDGLRLRYHMDRNQVLHLDLRLAAPHSEAHFEQIVESPLTYVLNPRTTRLEALELERKLSSSAGKARETLLVQAAGLYEDLGEYERAISNLRKALSMQKGESAFLVNKMALLVDHRGDKQRAEKLYHEAARLDPSSGAPLFNLALLQRRHGEYAAAIKNTDAALHREDSPPYNILRAKLAEDTGDEAGRTIHLDRANRAFGRLEDLDDWQLHWKGKATEMSRDDEAKAAHAAEEVRRRTRPAKERNEGILPVRKGGIRK